MKKNRFIPFGYVISNGIHIIYKPEADIVKLVFHQYTNGSSLKMITESLQLQDVRYHPDKAWNKHMVKRIIEDERYSGASDYPAIIDLATYTTANQIKTDKNAGIPIPLPHIINLVKSKAVCGVCGSKYTRRSDTHNGNNWRCSNPDCETKKRFRDKYILENILALLKAAIANPTLLSQTNNSDVQPNLEIMRLQNEISRELDKPQIDGKSVQSLIFECAAEKYKSCQGNTVSLEQEFANIQPTTEIDTALFDRTVKQVLISPNGNVKLKMLNDVILSL